jgi:hypothetical protein
MVPIHSARTIARQAASPVGALLHSAARPLISDACGRVCRALRLLDIRCAEPVGSAKPAHTSAINSLCWASSAPGAVASAPCMGSTSCEHLLLSVSFDPTVRIHDIRRLDAPVAALCGHSQQQKCKGIQQAAFTWGVCLSAVCACMLCKLQHCPLVQADRIRDDLLPDMLPLILALSSCVGVLILRIRESRMLRVSKVGFSGSRLQVVEASFVAAKAMTCCPCTTFKVLQASVSSSTGYGHRKECAW